MRRFLLFFCCLLLLFPELVSACVSPSRLTQLRTQAEFDLAQMMENLPEGVSVDLESAPNTRKFTSVERSQQVRVMRRRIGKFPAVFGEQFSAYYDAFENMDKVIAAIGQEGTAYEKYIYHYRIMMVIMPLAIDQELFVTVSDYTADDAERFEDILLELTGELSVANQRACKDEETEEEALEGRDPIELIDELKEIIASAGSLFDGLSFDNIGDTLDSAWNDISSGFDNSVNRIGDAFTSATNSLANISFDNLGQDISNAIDKGISDFGDEFNQGIADVNADLAALSDSINSLSEPSSGSSSLPLHVRTMLESGTEVNNFSDLFDMAKQSVADSYSTPVSDITSLAGAHHFLRQAGIIDHEEETYFNVEDLFNDEYADQAFKERFAEYQNDRTYALEVMKAADQSAMISSASAVQAISITEALNKQSIKGALEALNAICETQDTSEACKETGMGRSDIAYEEGGTTEGEGGGLFGTMSFDFEADIVNPVEDYTQSTWDSVTNFADNTYSDVVDYFSGGDDTTNTGVGHTGISP